MVYTAETKVWLAMKHLVHGQFYAVDRGAGAAVSLDAIDILDGVKAKGTTGSTSAVWFCSGTRHAPKSRKRYVRRRKQASAL